jgi:hypothetical protein
VGVSPPRRAIDLFDLLPTLGIHEL